MKTTFIKRLGSVIAALVLGVTPLASFSSAAYADGGSLGDSSLPYYKDYIEGNYVRKDK